MPRNVQAKRELNLKPYKQSILNGKGQTVSESPTRNKPKMTIDHIARNKAQVSLASKGNKYMHNDMKKYQKHEVTLNRKNVYDSNKYYKPVEYPRDNSQSYNIGKAY